jgi:hypothetical protein
MLCIVLRGVSEGGYKHYSLPAKVISSKANLFLYSNNWRFKMEYLSNDAAIIVNH